MPARKALPPTKKMLLLSAGDSAGLGLSPKQTARVSNAVAPSGRSDVASLGRSLPSNAGKRCKYGRRADGFCNDKPPRVDTLVVKHIGLPPNTPGGGGNASPGGGGGGNTNVVVTDPELLVRGAKAAGRLGSKALKTVTKYAPDIAGLFTGNTEKKILVKGAIAAEKAVAKSLAKKALPAAGRAIKGLLTSGKK